MYHEFYFYTINSDATDIDPFGNVRMFNHIRLAAPTAHELPKSFTSLLLRSQPTPSLDRKHNHIVTIYPDRYSA